MPTGIPNKPVQRLITITAIHEMNCSLQEVNTLLDEAGFPPMNASSYAHERNQYGPAVFGAQSNYTLREHCYTPRRRNQL